MAYLSSYCLLGLINYIQFVNNYVSREKFIYNTMLADIKHYNIIIT